MSNNKLLEDLSNNQTGYAVYQKEGNKQFLCLRTSTYQNSKKGTIFLLPDKDSHIHSLYIYGEVLRQAGYDVYRFDCCSKVQYEETVFNNAVQIINSIENLQSEEIILMGFAPAAGVIYQLQERYKQIHKCFILGCDLTSRQDEFNLEKLLLQSDQSNAQIYIITGSEDINLKIELDQLCETKSFLNLVKIPKFNENIQFSFYHKLVLIDIIDSLINEKNVILEQASLPNVKDLLILASAEINNIKQCEECIRTMGN